MKKFLNTAAIIGFSAALCLSGCSGINGDTKKTDLEAQEAVSNVPINFNVKVTGAGIEDDEMVIMYQVSLPEPERPASDMEFEKVSLLSADGGDAGCEFIGSELYSSNGQDDVWKLEYSFDGGVPAGNYWLELENYGYFEGEEFVSCAEGSWMLNCVVGSDKTAAEVKVDGAEIDGIELTECVVGQTSIVLKYNRENDADLGSVALNYKDGGRDEISQTTDKSTSTESDGSAVTIINFDDMVDINNIDSVEIMGQTFAL